MTIDRVREIADAVLYEGYLLYPYRASAAKNQSRWQFGVLGPPHASAASFSEEPGLSMQCLLRPRTPSARVTISLRFLQLQLRDVQRRETSGAYRSVPALDVDGQRLLTWDEAIEQEVTLPDFGLDRGASGYSVDVEGGEDIEPLCDATGAAVGRIVRRRFELVAGIQVISEVDDGHYRLTVGVDNQHPDPAADKDAAIRVSLIGAHVVLEAHDAAFVSLIDPPDEARAAVGRCRQHRCFPVLAGATGATDLVLGAPIILYDYPEIAEQSQGPLFDGTEIDEILTLRVMTMTEAEKAEARATDARARAIIDRCDAMSPADLQQLHGVLRDPAFDTGDRPWWDPAADAAVRPDTDAVTIDGVRIARGSLVRVHPSRRADAQDLFFAGQVARVTAVLSDVDGNAHVALVLVDDPAADEHEWYGRYFYFAPEELEPLTAESPDDREEVRR